MSDKSTGGPAFPVNELDQVTGNLCCQHMGMSLRDYFAAKAMQGELSAQSETSGYGVWYDYDDLAMRCYKTADAMLKAREA